VGTMIIRQSGAINLAPFLAKQFVFSLVVGFFAAYVAAHTLAREQTICRCFVSSAVSHSWLTGSAI